MRSTLAFLFSGKTYKDSTASYEQRFDKVHLKSNDSNDGLRFENIPNLQSMKNLKPTVFELKVNDNKPKLLPIYKSKSGANRDNPNKFLCYKNH